MEKNKLYTVNKWNRPLFGNRFEIGGGFYENIPSMYDSNPILGTPTFMNIDTSVPIPTFSNPTGMSITTQPTNIPLGTTSWDMAAANDYIWNPTKYAGVNDIKNAYMNSKNFFGLSKALNPLSKGNIAGGLKAMTGTPLGKVGLGMGASLASGLAYKGLSGGFDTGAGSAINSVGNMAGSIVGQFNPALGAAITVGSGVLGGTWNHTFGMKTNKDALNNYNNALASWNNYTSNANSYDQIQGPENFSFQNIYKGGLARGHDARQKNRNALANFNAAKDFAYRSMDNNIYNIGQNTIEDYMRGYGAALGGSLKTCGGNLFYNGGPEYPLIKNLRKLNGLEFNNLVKKTKSEDWENLVYQARPEGTNLLGYDEDGNPIETIINGYAPVKLRTFYPLGNEYPVTGHSELEVPISDNVVKAYGLKPAYAGLGANPTVIVSKKGSDLGYNLITNNCADATSNYLNQMYGKSNDAMFFTTPGDVRDYAVDKLGGKKTYEDGIETVLIPRNARNADAISEKALLLSTLKDSNFSGAQIEGYPYWLKFPYINDVRYLNGNKYIENQHSLGGNLFPDGGVLPEVVVTPSAEDKQVRKNFWTLFPDKDMRDSAYAYYDRQHVGDRLAQNEFLNNITTLHNLSGNPTIHRGDVISFLPAQYRKSNGTPRPHYVNNIVAPNDMYNINNFNDYLDELTHAYQYHGPKRYGLDTISWPGDIEINGKSGYDREGHPENAAHKIIGDAMKRYLIDNGLTMRNGKTNRENFVDKLALGIPDNYPVGQDWLSLGGNLYPYGSWLLQGEPAYDAESNEWTTQYNAPLLDEVVITGKSPKNNTVTVPTLPVSHPQVSDEALMALSNWFSNKYNYAKSYLKHKFSGDGDGTFINLSDKNVSRIDSDTKDVSSILTNDFVETRRNNAYRRKRDFENTNDTILGDRRIPLGSISNFYGVENGKLKAGPLSIFDDETTVVANRMKNNGKIKRLFFPLSREESLREMDEYYQKRDSIINAYNQEHGYKQPISYDIINFLLPFTKPMSPTRVLNEYEGYSARRSGKRNADFQHPATRLINEVGLKHPDTSLKMITEGGDTISTNGARLNATPKILFADENGNAAFVSNLRNEDNLSKLNDLLNEHPMYPIMVDNGRYSFYQDNLPNVGVYSGLHNPEDMFILGTTKSLGGNLFNNGGGIHIDPSKKGTFTAAASKHGMGVQEFASKVLSNKEDYSPAMVKKANFARNASKWHGLGGNLYSDGGPKGKKLIDDINSRSSADFVNRLKDENRSYIPDWNNRSNPYDYNWATHKMSWATDESGDAIVYPEVQTVNGKLHDFTDPWYGHGKWDGFNNAVENGDTLRMSPEQADWFTRNYKDYYPKGNTFAGGGYTAASFMDDFSQDPIAAVMNYRQMKAGMMAQREAMEEERAREEQMQNLQKQLMEAQTNYQGLQSLYDSQATAIKNLQDAYGNISPIIPPGANPGLLLAGVLSDALDSKWSTGTLPKNNKNWNYIKRKLKASGKFTDTQIDGIGLNLMRESGFDPEAIGDGGSAFGIAQWHGNRKPKDKTLDGQITHLINTLSEFDGKEHWIGRKNYNGFMNARTPEEAHYYIANGWERPKAVITDSLRREMNNSLINAGYAFGGELGTNGTDWYNGLLQVNEGSSHEMNPLGGVPMGVDQQGTPNLVEEGETVYAFGGALGGNPNPYVFSRRKEDEGGFNVPLDVLAQIGIKPTKKQLKEGISYAEASKVVAKESEERPMDDISQRGLEHGLGLLAQSQEQQRQEKQMMEQMAMDAQRGYAALGGRLCATGGNLFTDGGPTYIADKRGDNLLGYDSNGNPIELTVVANKKRKGKKARDLDNYTLFGTVNTKNGQEVHNKGYLGTDAGTLSKAAQLGIGLPLSLAGAAYASPSIGGGEWFNGSIAAPVMENASAISGLGIASAPMNTMITYSLIDNYNKKKAAEQMWKDMGPAPEEPFIPNDSTFVPSNWQPNYATGGSLDSHRVNLFATAGSLINPEDPPSWWNFADRVRYEMAKKEEEARNAPKAKKTKDVLAERAKKETSTTGKKALDEFYGRNSKSQNAENKVISKHEHHVQNPRPEERETNRINYSTVVGWDEPWDSHLDESGYPNAGFYRLTSPNLPNLRSGVYWTGKRVKEDGTLGNSDVSLNLERGWTPNGNIPYMASPVFHEWETPTEHDLELYLNNEGKGYHLTNYTGNIGKDVIKTAPSSPSQAPQASTTAKASTTTNGNGTSKGDGTNRRNAGNASENTVPTNNEPANTGATDVIAPVSPSDATNPFLNTIDAVKKSEVWKNLTNAITASKIRSLIDGEPTSEGSGETEREQVPIKPLPTWMRYAPIFVNGAMALTDMLGLTNKPDYEYANKLEAMANSAGYAPNINAPHIGDYMGYRPMDRLFFENQMQAAQRAADRNMMNTAGGNRATAMAGILGNNYNGYVSLGTLARQAEEYNLAQRMKQAEFNRGTNQANAQWDLQAQMANAQYRQMAKHYQMNAMAQAIAQRNAIDQMIGNARALNLTNFLNGLSGIGRENFAMNQINSDNGWDYGYGKKNGWSGYKWATPPYVKSNEIV